MPRRRSLPASVRMVLASGVAATGWLLFGATGAHAAEEPAVLTGPPPAATIHGALTPVTGTVDDAIGTTPVLNDVVPQDTVTTLTDTTLGMVRDPVAAVQDPVGTVKTITGPITGTVDELIGANPVVDGIVPPMLKGPGLTPGTPAPTQPVAGSPAAPVTTIPPVPAAKQAPHSTRPTQNAPALTPLSTSPGAAARPGPSVPPATTSSPGADSTTRIGVTPATSLHLNHRPLSMSAVGPGWDRTPTPSTGPAGASPGTAGPSSTSGGVPAPSGNGSTSGGGSGSPLGSADPAGWPGMPAGTFYLELFPRLIAGNENSFFGPAENLPAAPAFDPGSTPD